MNNRLTVDMLKKYFYTMNRQCSTAKCEIIMTVFLIMLKYLEVMVDFKEYSGYNSFWYCGNIW